MASGHKEFRSVFRVVGCRSSQEPPTTRKTMRTVGSGSGSSAFNVYLCVGPLACACTSSVWLVG